MFKKITLLSIFALLTFSSLTVYRIAHISPYNEKRYESVLKEFQPKNVQNSGVTSRSEVSKNLWVKKEDQLYQYLIKSEGSSLHLNQLKAKGLKVIEKMNEVTCLLQQKIFYVDASGQEVDPKEVAEDQRFERQHLCCLTVKKGTYNYFTKCFEGQKALIELIELPYHSFPNERPKKEAKMLLKGTCDTLYFHFIETKPNLKLHNLTAQIYEDLNS